MFKTCLRIVARPASYSRPLSSSIRRLQDPWLLPNTPAHEAATQTPPDQPPLAPLPRTGESAATLRARLLYQSRKRGTLEADLLLSTFAAAHLRGMTHAELQEYDKLLDEPDWDIYYWATERRQPPERWARSELLQRLCVHARNEGKVVRRMPDVSATKGP